MAENERRAIMKLSGGKVLFASALASAGFAAFLTFPRTDALRPARAPGGATSPDVAGPTLDGADPSGENRVHPTRGGDAPTELELREADSERQEEIALTYEAERDEIERLHVPTVEEARRMRLDKATPRADIVDRGIDALSPELKCAAPAVLSTAGRRGPGMLGCVVESKEGMKPQGRVALRTRNGNFEVGEFEDGLREGLWEQYYPSGVLASRGSFAADQRVGSWHEFDEGGAHVVTRGYEDGRLHGVTVHFWGKDPEVALYWSLVGELDVATREPIQEKVAVLK